MQNNFSKLPKQMGHVFLRYQILPKILNTNWKFNYDGNSWEDAGKNDLKVRCGFRPISGK